MKTQTNQEKVLDIFLDDPLEKFHLREIARMTGLNPNTVLNISGKLVEEELLLKEKKRHVVEFSANVNERFRELKIVRNLGRIYDSGLVNYLNKHFKNPRAIVLFGSFRKGEDINGSEIDIAIENNGFEKYEIEKLKGLEGFEKEFKKEIEIHLFKKGKVDINLFNSILNGIILSGFLEVNKNEL